MSKKIDKLFTIEEVAELLRVSKRTVIRYIETGKLKASKIGFWRVSLKDLREFLENTSNLKKINEK